MESTPREKTHESIPFLWAQDLGGKETASVKVPAVRLAMQI